MALIGKIRENSWFLIALLVLGMGGFLFMDMIGGSRGSSLMGSRNLVGKIEGEKVMIDKFLQREQNFFGNSTGDVYEKREEFWNFYVEETLLQKEAENLGMGVSPAELKEMFIGPNVSPIVAQEFGQDVSQVNQYLEGYANLPPNVKNYWYELENRMIKDQLENKLNAMVGKALYTPTWMAEEVFKGQSTTADISYVTIPYSEVDNAEVSVSDDELKAYINQNRARYTFEEETRRIDFVSFEVEPTAADSSAIKNRVAQLAAGFATAENDSAFIVENYGSYLTEYIYKEELSPAIADTLFKVPVGTIIGPYLDNGTGQYTGKAFYRDVKLIDRKVVPDSVQARHILIPVENGKLNVPGMARARKTVDSLKTLIEKEGAIFDTLARDFGTDGTRLSGGDLGMQGPKGFVSEFRDLIFYRATPKKLYSVVTSFGVHLVEVTKTVNTGQTGVRVAYVGEVIVPSRETQDLVYNKAFQFVRDNRNQGALDKSILEMELDKRSASGLKINDFVISGLGGGDASRNLVKWSFQAKVGDVSPEIYTYEDPVEYFNTRYVISTLTGITAPGLASVDDVRDEVQSIVINKKKAEKIISALKGVDMETAASNYNQEISDLEGLTFNGFSVLSGEPKVIAAALGLNIDQTSAPIAGKTGVYIVRLVNKTEGGPPTNLPAIRRQETAKMTNTLNSRFGTTPLMKAMKEKASITDNRAKYF